MESVSKKKYYSHNLWRKSKVKTISFVHFEPKINVELVLIFRYASNIVFSNGLMDPWSGGGVLRAPNDQITVILIPDTAHHLDLRAANSADPPSVVAARQIELNEIRKWLGSANYVY